MNDDTTPLQGNQDIEAEELAAKHDIPVEDARQLIDQLGYDRALLDAAAQKRKLGQS